MIQRFVSTVFSIPLVLASVAYAQTTPPLTIDKPSMDASATQPGYTKDGLRALPTVELAE